MVNFPRGFGYILAATRQSIARERLPGVSANDLLDGTLGVRSGTWVVNGVPVSVRPAPCAWCTLVAWNWNNSRNISLIG